MMKVFRSLLLAALACAPAMAQHGGAVRNWTSNDGKVISGSMLGTEGESVAIKLAATGKQAKVPLARLTEEDRAFVAAKGWPLPKPWKGWPTDIKINLDEVNVEVVTTGRKPIYRTQHFEILSADELGQTVVKDIGRIFEGTYRLLSASPWGMLAKPKDGHFHAELYRTRDDYIQAGGPSNSAGVYMPARKVFMVPFESLGLKESPKGWQRSSDYTTKTIVHELTHMMMDDALQTMPMWLIEGAAEYMELMPMRIGTFSPAGQFAALKEHNKSEPAFSLAETFSMTHAAWQNGGRPPSPPPATPSRQGPGGIVVVGPTPFGGNSALQEIPKLYHAGLLLTYYFMHLDGDGDAARLQRFIAASTRNAERIDTYRKDQEAYETAFQEFIKRPEVKDMGGGNYRFPATLKPPQAPAFPFDCSPEQLPFQEIDILLDGRETSVLIDQIKDAIMKQKLIVGGGSPSGR
jgi:hypothetical protein